MPIKAQRRISTADRLPETSEIVGVDYPEPRTTNDLAMPFDWNAFLNSSGMAMTVRHKSCFLQLSGKY